MTPIDSIVARLTSLHPKLIDLSLDRMRRVLGALGHPEQQLPPVIHVAGTNGKGSTIAFMRAILEAAGLRVHVYTSPHLVRFNERFRLGGKGEGRLASDEELSSALNECERVNAGASITVFEVTTAAGFLLFARNPADVLLLEVGMGGRLDATNVVDRPLASIITPVSLDHAEHLGDSIGKIAGEKAGILKPNVPAIVAAQPREALISIERQAARVKAPIRIAGEDWMATEERGRLVYQDDAGLLDLPAPKLYGRHQFENAGVAIAALRAVGELKLTPEAFETGMAKADWPARMQRLSQGRLAALTPPGSELWLDGGHNPDGGRAIANARGGHAGDQGLREFLEEFCRACPSHRGGADPPSGQELPRRHDRRYRAQRRHPGAKQRERRGGARRDRPLRARAAAAHPDHRLALSRRRRAQRKRHHTGVVCER
jgi:dihydrofolate synthase/folylpolyglutamate synthase